MSRTVCFVLLLGVMTGMAAMGQEPTAAARPATGPGARLPTASGQWWQYRGDQWLSGRSQARGNITALDADLPVA